MSIRELPTGTVTFLFSDIEGSTKLLQTAGDDYSTLLERHAALVRAAVSSCEGMEVSTEGDSFFLVFRSPRSAIRAAAEIQRSLQAETWPGGLDVRVRIGIHTGEGVLGHDNYAGIDVNRAARVAGAAHGGQILLTGATRGLVEGTLPQGVGLRDLGLHRLKDLPRPEPLHQLDVEGLPVEFPPPRTLDARPNNLPMPPTRFIGRLEVVGEVVEAMRDARLLTLTGPGGTGKTRVAIRTAAEVLLDFADGAFFADLSPLMDPGLVASTIAEALGVGEDPGRTMAESVAAHLADRELLLVLDNFEQVTDAAGLVSDLLKAAPRLKVLVTSRVPLHVYGEREFPVPPLLLPDPAALPDAEAVSQFEAVMLFIDRAVAARPDFVVTNENAPAVAEICYRLDGLPLAIELAASRVKVLTPDAMLPRLEHRLQLLTSRASDLPERQRTLRGAIEWSHDLLEETDRRLFARVAVFMGGTAFEGADLVCNPGEELGLDTLDGLDSLVDKSLLRRSEEGGEVRFSMLETIREFGLERLEESGEAETIRRHHAQWVTAVAEEAEPELIGEHQRRWFTRIDLELDNVRAALRWALDRGEPGLPYRITGALWRFYQQRGHLQEGRAWTEEALALPETAETGRDHARALTAAGGLAYWQNDYAAAGSWYEAAVGAWLATADDAGIANALYDRSFIYLIGGDRDRARAELHEALARARAAGDRLIEATILAWLGQESLLDGEPAGAVEAMEQAVALYREVGNRFHLADSLSGVALGYALLGDVTGSRAALIEAIELFREADNPTGLGQSIWGAGVLAVLEGRFERAMVLLGADAANRERVGGGAPPEVLDNVSTNPEVAARDALDPAVADATWERGRAMSLDQAIAYVLSNED